MCLMIFETLAALKEMYILILELRKRINYFNKFYKLKYWTKFCVGSDTGSNTNLLLL